MNTISLPNKNFGETAIRAFAWIILSVSISIYAITAGIDFRLLLMASGGAIVFVLLHSLSGNCATSSLENYAICFLLALVICGVSFYSGVSILRLIVPLLLALVISRDRIVFSIPVAFVALYILVFQTTEQTTDLIIAASSLAVAFAANGVVSRFSYRYEEKLQLANLLSMEREEHMKFLNAFNHGGIGDENPFSPSDDLGNALFQLSSKVRKAGEDDKKRAWHLGGLNELNAIIRSSSDVEKQYNTLISFFVKYVCANQGGLFVVNREGDSHLEMKACYAYDKHKMAQKTVAIGDGLLGQCVLEKEIIYLEKVPVEYVHITSGLGLATPTSLVIVPICYNDEVLGVLELASLQKFANHHLDFLRKASEVIGGAILTFQQTALMKRMLEESKVASAELRAQQEETRQNLEELEATQEHLLREGKEREKLQDELRKSKEFLNIIIDSVPIPVFVKNREHKMILVNKAVCELNDLKREQMLGKSDYDFFSREQADIFWNAEEEIFTNKRGVEKIERVSRHGKETMTVDKKLVVETGDGDTFLVGINIDLTSYQALTSEKIAV